MIMSRHQAFYFDMTYAQRPLQNTYKFEPVQGGIHPESVKNVLGVEAEMWTEFIPSVRRLELFLFPRMQALSEVAWYTEGKTGFQELPGAVGTVQAHLGCFWCKLCRKPRCPCQKSDPQDQ